MSMRPPGLLRISFVSPLAPPLQATPMGLRAKQSVAARNRVLLLGMSALIAANACFSLVPSYLGEQLGCMHLNEASVCHVCMPMPPLFATLPTKPPPCHPAHQTATPAAHLPAHPTPPLPACPRAGMAAGNACIGLHMAMTQVAACLALPGGCTSTVPPLLSASGLVLGYICVGLHFAMTQVSQAVLAEQLRCMTESSSAAAVLWRGAAAESSCRNGSLQWRCQLVMPGPLPGSHLCSTSRPFPPAGCGVWHAS